MAVQHVSARQSRRAGTFMGAVLASIVCLAWLPAAAAGQVDLVLNLTDAPDPVPAGGDITYSVSVSNDGIATATTVQFTLDVPSNATFEGFTGTGVSCSGMSIGQPGVATLTCALPDLASLASSAFTVLLGTSAAGAVNITAQVAAAEGDTQPANNSLAEMTTVIAGADVALTLTGPATAASGSSVSYAVDLTNAGPDAATSLTVQFPLPTGFLLTGSLPAGCSLGGSTITCSVAGPIASGGSLSVGNVTGQISAASGSTVTATSSVAVSAGAPPTTPQDPNTSDNTSVSNISVTAGSDVMIAKAFGTAGPYFVADTIDFVLTASYTGDSPNSLVINDNLPANYTVDSGSFNLSQNGWTCSVAGQLVNCTRPSGGAAGANQSLGTITIPVIINSAGTAVSNSASIGSASPLDPNMGNNTANDGGANLLVPTADLAVSKGGPSPALVVVGVPFDFTLTTSNGGPKEFFGTMTMTDALPAGLTVTAYTENGWSCLPAAPVSGPANIDCARTYTAGSPLAAGANAPTVTFNTTATTTGSLTNGVSLTTVGANVPDPNPANNATNRGVTSSPPAGAADISVVKTVDLATVPAGEVLTYTIQIVNSGPVPATSVTLTDDLNTLINNGVGPTDSGYVGHTIAENAVPAGQLTCSTASTGSTSRRLTCAVVTLPVCIINVDCPTIDVQIRPGGNGGGRTNTATAISADVADDNLSNNSGSVTSTIQARADIAASKTATPDPTAAGQQVVYVVTATNNGPSQATSVSVVDDLPLGMVFDSASPSAGSCSSTPTPGSVTALGNRTVTCNLGTINNGAQRTVTIRAKPTNATRGTTLTNNVTVGTTTTEPTVPGAANNTASAPVTVSNPSLDILVNKSEDVDPVAIGDTTNYSIVVTNVGPSDAENVVITDNLPAAGLSFQSFTLPGGSCSTVPAVGSFGGTLVCSVARLSFSTSATLTVSMQGATKGVYSNTVSVVTDETGLGFEDGSNNTSNENTTVRTRADVEVVSKIPSGSPIAIRRPFTWTVKVRNNVGAGLAEADSVSVSDNLPAGMELTATPTITILAGTISASTCTGTAGSTSFSCDLGTFSNGGEVDITVPVRQLTVPSGGTATNSASISTSSLDPVAGNDSNSGNVTIQGSSLSGTVFRDFDANGASNGSDTGIPGIQMIVSGLAFDGSPVADTVTTTAGGTYTFVDLPEGNYTIQRGTVSEAHLVVGQQTAGDRGGDAATAPQISSIALGGIDTGSNYLFAFVPQARIGIAKRVVGSPAVAADSSYTATLRLVVTNPSLEALSSVTIDDPMTGAAPGLGTFVAGGAGATLSAGQYTIQTLPAFVGACATGLVNAAFDGSGDVSVGTISSLPASGSCEIGFDVRYHPIVPLPGAGYSNQADVGGTGALSGQTPTDLSQDGANPDPDSNGDPGDNNVPTPLTPTLVADVTTSVSFAGPVDAGQTVSGTVLFTNNGPFDATAVTYTLSLTPGLSGVTFGNLPAGATATYAPSTGTVTFTNMPTTLSAAQIASGDGTSGITVSYTQPASGTSTVNSGIGTSTSQGANAAQDADSATITGVGSAVAGVSKNGTLVGNTVTYDVELENLGFSVANSVSVPDDLDAVFGAGNYTVTSGPTLTTAPAGGSLTMNASFTGSGANTDLIDQTTPLANTMAIGDVAIIRFQVQVTNVTNQGNGIGVFHNQVTSSARAPGGVGPFTDTSVDGTNPDPDNNGDPGDNTSPTILSLAPNAVIGIAKAGMLTGDTVTYDIKVKNTGNAVADSILVTDDLNATFGAGNYQLLGTPALTVAPSSGSLTLDAGFTGVAPNVNLVSTVLPAGNTLPPGDSAVIQMRVHITNVTDQGFGLGTFHNSANTASRGPGGSAFTDASVDGPDVDPTADNNPGNDTSPTIVSLAPDGTIGVAKSAQVFGTTVTFQITLENKGNTVANSISVTDDLDAVFGAGNYTITSPPSFVLDPGTLTLDAAFTGQPGTAELIDQTAPLANTLAFGAQAIITFSVNVTTVTDVGSGFGIYSNQATTVSMGPGATGPFTDMSEDGGDVDPDGDGDPTNNSIPTPVEIKPADIGVTKTGPATARVGDAVTYTLTVTNAGPGVALNVQLQDQLPAGVAFVSASDGGAESSGTITWPNIGQMNAGASEIRTVEVTAVTAGSWENVALATSSTPDLNQSNNDGTADPSRTTVIVEEPGADLVVRKSGPPFASAGDTATYVITTRNNGPGAADSVIVVDSLASASQFVSASRGGVLQGGSVVWPAVLTLPLGSVITDTVRVVLPVEGTYVDIASATSSTPDPDPSNNDGSDPGNRVTTVTTRVDVAITKRLTSDLTLGAEATFELTVTNVGTVPVSERITVVDTLPDPLTFVSASGINWSCSAVGQIVTCTHPGQLGPNDATSLILTVLVRGGAGESIVNTASVGTPGDPDGPDNTDSTEPTQIQDVGQLELEKTVSESEVEVGDLVRYELVLRNVGAGVVTDVTIEDRLPTGFMLVPGTVRIDDIGANNPIGSPGPILDFAIGDVAGGRTVRVTYTVRVGVGAELGDGVNRARATGSGGQAQSNAVAAAVGLRKGVFTDEGLIVGRVWVGVSDSTELTTDGEEERYGHVVGVPGVRIYLHDGASAITDREGRYSFDGLQPRHWIVRVDERTLPDNMVPRRLTNRHHGGGSSKLVDLTRGELARADFGDFGADTALIGRVLDRVALGPVPGVAVPSRIAAHAPTSVGAGQGSWRSQARLTPQNSNIAPSATAAPSAFQGLATSTRPGANAGTGGSLYGGESLSPLFRRAGSTSGMALNPAANRWAGTAAVTGMGSDGTDPSARERLGLLVTGLFQGRFDWRSLSNGELLTSGVRDRFQEALVEVATSNDEGTLALGARATAFATGEVGDGYQVTLRLDTEKDKGRRLFNDIRPDELYDVFGDASSTLFEAQSKGRVFGAVGRGDSYVMYGDFTTASYDPSQLLGRYSRTLNGVMHQYQSERASVRTFASRDRFQQVVDELPALGISGPYALTRADGLVNSERVEIVTRDRSQPGVILDIVPLERFTDYSIEPFTGRLVFKRPIASVDERLNPVSIRVTYEAEGGGERFWVLGAEAQARAGNRMSLGAGVVRNDDPMGRYDLASANATLAIADGTWMTGEVARSDSAGVQDGTALRLELRHASERLDVRGFYMSADSLFQNPSAGVGIGRTELGLTGRAIVADETALFGELLRSEDDRNNGALNGARVALQRRFNERWNAEVGFRHASEDRASSAATESIVPNDVNALGVRAEGSVFKDGSIFAEYEQDVNDDEARRLGVGATFRLLERARLYARHELLSSLAAPYQLNSQQERSSTVFGLAADYREGQSVFSEYRVGSRLEGREAHAAIGLRNLWTLEDGVRVNTSFERVSPISGGSPLGSSTTTQTPGAIGDGSALAVAAALEITTSPLWKGSLRGEFRATEVTDHFLGTAGFARRLRDNLTLLAQSSVSKVLDGGALYERTRIGLAYRGTDRNNWNSLARYEHRTNDDPSAAGGPVEHSAHVWSAHVNARLIDGLTTRAQWAAKFATDRVAGTPIERSAQLLSGRATLDVAAGIDVGLIGRTMFDDARRQFGLGLEAGIRVSDDLRLGAGYNWFGFRDDDLALDEYTDRGFYIDLGWSFDETFFGFGDKRQQDGDERRRVGERQR